MFIFYIYIYIYIPIDIPTYSHIFPWFFIWIRKLPNYDTSKYSIHGLYEQTSLGGADNVGEREGLSFLDGASSFGKVKTYMGGSVNGGIPPNRLFYWDFHYKPAIFGYPPFRETPI